jgi:hypothetical protein
MILAEVDEPGQPWNRYRTPAARDWWRAVGLSCLLLGLGFFCMAPSGRHLGIPTGTQNFGSSHDAQMIGRNRPLLRVVQKKRNPSTFSPSARPVMTLRTVLASPSPNWAGANGLKS